MINSVSVLMTNAPISSIHSVAGSPNGAPQTRRRILIISLFGTGLGATTFTAPLSLSLVVIAIIAILAGLLLPVLSKSQGAAQGARATTTSRNFSLAWFLYASDNSDLLVNNYGKPQTISTRNTWASNVEGLEQQRRQYKSPVLTQTPSIPLRHSRAARFSSVPADRAPAANGPRIRSVSMNSMVGDPGDLANQFNPLYVQFFKR